MTQKIFEHWIVSALCGVALLFVLGGFFWTYFSLRATGGPFILHFNDIGGITSVGGLGSLVFMGVFGVIVVLMNFAIALEFDSKDKFFGKFLAATTLVFAVLLFIAFIAILSVNV
jgi:hypothetical protein